MSHYEQEYWNPFTQPLSTFPSTLYVPIYSVLSALYDSFKQLGDKQESVSTGLGRSDTSFTDVLNDFSEMDGEERMSESKKLERACRKGIQRIWLFDEVESCPKLGSWKRRTDHLHNDISKLEQHCSKKQKRNLEEAEEAEEEIEEAN